MHQDIIYYLALTQVPQIGPVLAKNLLTGFPDARSIFTAPKKELIAVAGISDAKASAIVHFNAWQLCESELKFCEKHDIKVLSLQDAAYPSRLLQCYDPPTVLFYKGNANLNAERVVSVVGTRSATSYGKEFTERMIAEFAEHQITVISGLAFGIDTIAHKACAQLQVPTIGVVAHGLHTIYPSENAKLAKQMISNGGVLTELWSGEQPDKHNFPTRNRLVAGMADAVVVIETNKSGGSMITAELAHGYNRDLFALPGKVTDDKSMGCNHLIKTQKANMLTSATDMLDMMNWLPKEVKKQRPQRELFITLSPAEKTVFDILNGSELVHIDALRMQAALSPSALATALLSLELQSLITTMPGNLYKVI